MRKVLVTRTARAPVHESQTTLATRTSLKQELDDAHGELLPKNREEERQQGSSGGGCQTADVIESERYRAHLAYDCIAVAEIGERLDIACSEESLGRGLPERTHFGGRYQRSVGRATRSRPILSFASAKRGVNIKSGPRIASTKKTTKPTICTLKEEASSPR